MKEGLIESSRFLRNPLDVLAQQIVAHVAISGDTNVSDLKKLVRRFAGFAEISDELLSNVLDLLAGRYPSEEFSELRPRIVWDRVNDVVRARDGSRRLAVTSGGIYIGAFTPGESALLKDLAERFTLRFFRFSSTTTRMDDLTELTYGGTHTRVGDALDGAREELAGVPLAGLVLVSTLTGQHPIVSQLNGHVFGKNSTF